MPSTKPPIPLSLAAFQPKFTLELKRLMEERSSWGHTIDPSYGKLLEHLTQLVTRGGKRLRPYLMYLAHIGSGGRDNPGIIRASASQELYHNAWLIHDDLIDRDLVRHDGANIAGVYRSQFHRSNLADADHLADAMALLAGDFSLSLASEIILTSDYPANLLVAAARRMQETSLGETGGEMLDVLMPTTTLEKVTPERLLQIYHYKTAAYSFELPLHTGAILAGAPAIQLSNITNFAIPLGIAFQIADDLLGMFGNEEQLGKPVISDLREGKRTFLLLNGLKMTSPAARTRLLALSGNPAASHHHLVEAKAILEACGARAETEAFARRYLHESLSALGECAFTPEVTSALQDLAKFVVSRSI